MNMIFKSFFSISLLFLFLFVGRGRPKPYDPRERPKIVEEEIDQAIENATMKRAAKLGWL